MEWVETTGRSVEEAIDAALDQLGVHEEDLEYEVISQPKGGFLGRFGGSEARIRARVRPVSREKPGERRRRSRRRGGAGAGGGPSEERGVGATARPESERAGAGTGPAAAPPAAAGRGRIRGPGRPESAPAERIERGGEQQVDVPIEEQVGVAESFTRGLVEAFGVPATVRTRVDDDETVCVDIEGGDLGLLIGPRGATLAALEELVRTVVQRHTGGHSARVVVDVAGYQVRRRGELEAFARTLVERALETGREQVLEPMSSADRKVVHDVVAGIDGVETASEGEDPRRRVVIRPV
ncbi:MAG: Jag N-terminal domain-containing protein [Acidimicrobiia bacterium]|nr:Jag N-terminal domain-containing protein [Acidimicrobiia bacterium]